MNKTLRRFDKYTSDMIECKNPSYLLEEDILKITNNKKGKVLAWDEKDSGKITFDFEEEYEMGMCTVISFGGKW